MTSEIKDVLAAFDQLSSEIHTVRHYASEDGNHELLTRLAVVAEALVPLREYVRNS